MRISTSSIYSQGASNITAQQQKVLQLQNQISSGNKVQNASDDPIAMAQINFLNQKISRDATYKSNIDAATSALTHEDNLLSSILEEVHSLRTLMIQSGNGTTNDSDRKSLVAQAQAIMSNLLGHANTSDSSGHYIFSGSKTDTAPFVKTLTGVTYMGDQLQRFQSITDTSQVAINDTGYTLFEHIKTSSKLGFGLASSSNTGTAVGGDLSITNASALTDHSYSLVFNVSGSTTTYDILDTTASTTVSTGNAYVSGQPISFDGMQLSISGAPANADHLEVKSQNYQQGLFETLQGIIDNLDVLHQVPADKARFTHNSNIFLKEVDNIFDTVLKHQSSVGARLNQLESIGSLNDDQSILNKQVLGQLQETDYAEVASAYSLQMVSLQAAQQSFVKIQNLSIFNYIN